MNAPREALIHPCSFACGDGHRLHIGLAGADDGIPLAVFHGGPGSASNAQMLAPVDLTRFRVVMIDQRGCGRSRPMGRVQRNSTPWLIRDIEAIRRFLKIPRWYVMGGSWGATLSIAYAGMYPDVVGGLVLRGTFLASQREIRSLLSASRHRAPREWLNLYHASGADRPASLLRAAHDRLLSGDANSKGVAQAYSSLERAVLGRADRAMKQRSTCADKRRDRQMCAKYRIQTHYLLQDCGLRGLYLNELASRIDAAGIKVIAIHGRNDPVCPPANLDWLQRHMPHMRTVLIDAGHLATNTAMKKALVNGLLEISRGYDNAMPHPRS